MFGTALKPLICTHVPTFINSVVVFRVVKIQIKNVTPELQQHEPMQQSTLFSRNRNFLVLRTVQLNTQRKASIVVLIACRFSLCSPTKNNSKLKINTFIGYCDPKTVFLKNKNKRFIGDLADPLV